MMDAALKLCSVSCSLEQQPSSFLLHNVNSIMTRHRLLETGSISEADDNEEQVNEFDGLDLRQASCFGYGCPKADSWTNLA